MANQSEPRSPGYYLQRLNEVLYVPLIFYILTLWDKQDTPQEHVGLVLIFFLVQIEYYSIMTNYDNYKFRYYLCDIYSFTVYFAALTVLSSDTYFEIGYDPIFWFFIALIWLGFAAWNFLFYRDLRPDPYGVKVRNWGFKMVVFFVIGAACSFTLIEYVNSPELPNREAWITGLQLVPVCLVAYTVFEWLAEMVQGLSTASEKNNKR